VPPAIAITAVVFVAPAAAAAAAALSPPLSSPPPLPPLSPSSPLSSLLPSPPPPRPPLLLQSLVGCCVVHKGLLRVARCCHRKDCIVPPYHHHRRCHRPRRRCMSFTPALLSCQPDRLASLTSRRSPPARLASSPAPPSRRVVRRPACLALSIIPPPRVIQHPLATQVIYLDLIVVFIIPVECGCDEGRADGLAGRFISAHPWNTVTITSKWTRHPQTSSSTCWEQCLLIFRDYLDMLASYFVFHDCASTKMATKKIDEVQIWLVLAQ
jgi:hypothetical protein